MTEQPDSADIDALESLLISEGWVIVWKRLIQTIEDKRDELERDHSESRAIPYAQGFIAACRMMAAMPQNLTDEFKTKIGAK